ncbi:MAG: Asp23/Gls24 family envelope stress response protein [Dorea sp.]|nr:Asp23/Gls24 family envelope stress response protein [Dorea sp.]
MGKEEKSTYTIQKEESVGEVKIADEVVASIAAFATMDVEGVGSMGGNVKEKGRLSMKSPSKGVKLDVLEGVVTVTLTLNLVYGYSLIDVSSRIQEKVKTSIESMTGLKVADVNIRVAGVDVPEEV